MALTHTGWDVYLTWGELKHLMQDIPDDTAILCEGCDCTGLAGGVSNVFDYTLWDGQNDGPTIRAIEIVRRTLDRRC